MGPDFLARTAQQWQKAQHAGLFATRVVQIAAISVRLHFAAPTVFEAFWPAISHLEIADLPPDFSPNLDIFLWDAATGVPLPAPDADLRIGPQGHIAGLPEPLRAAFNLDSGVLQVYAPHENCAFVALRDAQTLPPYERAAPLRVLWGWIGETHDFVAAHGAAVAWNDCAILLAGRGGSGKSTTSLACLLAGFDFLGDDYVLVRGGAAPRVWSLYRTAKVGARSLELHPHLKNAIAIEPRPQLDDKWVLFADKLESGGQLVREKPLGAIVLPRVEGQSTQLAPCSASRALAALAPSSIFQLAGAGPILMEKMAALTRCVAAHELRLAPDNRAPFLLKQWLERAKFPETA